MLGELLVLGLRSTDLAYFWIELEVLLLAESITVKVYFCVVCGEKERRLTYFIL